MPADYATKNPRLQEICVIMVKKQAHQHSLRVIPAKAGIRCSIGRRRKTATQIPCKPEYSMQ